MAKECGVFLFGFVWGFFGFFVFFLHKVSLSKKALCKANRYLQLLLSTHVPPHI